MTANFKFSNLLQKVSFVLGSWIEANDTGISGTKRGTGVFLEIEVVVVDVREKMK